jgi:hypothetical protein
MKITLPITLGTWIVIVEFLAAALAALASFLQAGNFAPYAIVLFVAALLQLLITYLTNKVAISLGLKK